MTSFRDISRFVTGVGLVLFGPPLSRPMVLRYTYLGISYQSGVVRGPHLLHSDVIVVGELRGRLGVGGFFRGNQPRDLLECAASAPSVDNKHRDLLQYAHRAKVLDHLLTFI